MPGELRAGLLHDIGCPLLKLRVRSPLQERVGDLGVGIDRDEASPARGAVGRFVVLQNITSASRFSTVGTRTGYARLVVIAAYPSETLISLTLRGLSPNAGDASDNLDVFALLHATTWAHPMLDGAEPFPATMRSVLTAMLNGRYWDGCLERPRSAAIPAPLRRPGALRAAVAHGPRPFLGHQRRRDVPGGDQCLRRRAVQSGALRAGFARCPWVIVDDARGLGS
jgi:hypothetical protein